MDDLKQRVEANEENVQQIHISQQRRMNQVQEDFSTLKAEFRREEEFSRVSRKAADNLQEEYCRLVNSVASEKQRNLMYIERAKREFVTEITSMSYKVNEIDKIEQKVNVLAQRS